MAKRLKIGKATEKQRFDIDEESMMDFYLYFSYYNLCIFIFYKDFIKDYEKQKKIESVVQLD